MRGERPLQQLAGDIGSAALSSVCTISGTSSTTSSTCNVPASSWYRARSTDTGTASRPARATTSRARQGDVGTRGQQRGELVVVARAQPGGASVEGRRASGPRYDACGAPCGVAGRGEDGRHVEAQREERLPGRAHLGRVRGQRPAADRALRVRRRWPLAVRRARLPMPVELVRYAHPDGQAQPRRRCSSRTTDPPPAQARALRGGRQPDPTGHSQPVSVSRARWVPPAPVPSTAAAAPLPPAPEARRQPAGGRAAGWAGRRSVAPSRGTSISCWCAPPGGR